MKCPECGTENLEGAGACKSCGVDADAQSGSQTQIYGRVDHHDVAQRMRLDYSSGQREPVARAMDGITVILQHFHRPNMSVRAVLEDAANFIQRQFAIREVAIGLRSPSDGLYRYEVLLGFREEASTAHKTIAYTEADFWSEDKYKATVLSRQTRLFLTEDVPYVEQEKSTYNRQVMLLSKRTSIYECLEGDYIDIIIPGQNNEALGWIEISGTRGGRLPDAAAIKWIEFIAGIIGAAIVCYDIRRIMARESSKRTA